MRQLCHKTVISRRWFLLIRITGCHVPYVSSRWLRGKASGRGLSDLAAMGAEPKSVLLSLTLPTLEPGWIDHFANRFHQLCVRFGVDLIGGDTTKGPLSAHLTVLGQVPKGSAVTRRGLKSGDDLWLFGPDLGGARAYLDVLDGQEPDHEIWAERYWRPEPSSMLRIAQRWASVMIDNLLIVPRLITPSRSCGRFGKCQTAIKIVSVMPGSSGSFWTG